MPSTWECPSCKRRVPADVEECRCGVSRGQAESLLDQRAATGASKAMPWDLKVWIGLLILTVLLALGWIVLRPWRPEPIPPILGRVDRPPPSPTAKPVSPAPRRP